MITVRLFALLREAAAADTVSLPAAEAPTVAAARRALEARHPELGPLFRERPILVVVNRRYASDDTELGDGDEVAFLPPVSGG